MESWDLSSDSPRVCWVSGTAHCEDNRKVQEAGRLSSSPHPRLSSPVTQDILPLGASPLPSAVQQLLSLKTRNWLLVTRTCLCSISLRGVSLHLVPAPAVTTHPDVPFQSHCQRQETSALLPALLSPLLSGTRALCIRQNVKLYLVFCGFLSA